MLVAQHVQGTHKVHEVVGPCFAAAGKASCKGPPMDGGIRCRTGAEKPGMHVQRKCNEVECVLEREM